MISFPDVVPGESVVVSATTYSAYRMCPQSAVLRLQGVYGPDSVPGFVGGLAHRVFARHLTAGPIPAPEFDRVCKAEIGSSSLNMKLGPLGLGPSRLSGLIAEVGAMYERFKRLPADGFAGAEAELEVEPSPGVTLRGAIDAAFDTPDGTCLVDWKTGVNAEAGDQLRFYALLWALEREELPVRLEAVSVKTGERSELIPTSDDLVDVVDHVAELITTVRTLADSDGEAERVGGPWCRYCPDLENCAEGRAAAATLSGGARSRTRRPAAG